MCGAGDAPCPAECYAERVVARPPRYKQQPAPPPSPPSPLVLPPLALPSPQELSPLWLPPSLSPKEGPNTLPYTADGASPQQRGCISAGIESPPPQPPLLLEPREEPEEGGGADGSAGVDLAAGSVNKRLDPLAPPLLSGLIRGMHPGRWQLRVNGLQLDVRVRRAPTPPRATASARPTNVRIRSWRVCRAHRVLHVIHFAFGARESEVARHYSDFCCLRDNLWLRQLDAPFPGKTFGGCTGRNLQIRAGRLEAWVAEAVSKYWPHAGLRAFFGVGVKQGAA